MAEWISVKDELPVDNSYVLVRTYYEIINHTDIWIARKDSFQTKIKWWKKGSGYITSLTPVTHWMPLPDEPKSCST